MSQGKAFATSVIKLALPLTAIAAAASLPAGAAFAAHSIRAGIYEEFPVELRCLTTGNCIVYFDTVDRDLIVDKVSCTLKMKTTNNPRILRVVLGRATADKASFAESFFLPAPQTMSTGALIAVATVADTQAVIPATRRTAVLAEIAADAMAVDVTLRCAISGHQP